jgi:hypothetical protein
MANVLPVPTGEVGNPILMFILMISDDRLIHVAGLERWEGERILIFIDYEKPPSANR